jgi:hypothetical protein
MRTPLRIPLIIVVFACGLAMLAPGMASAHRDGCHVEHSCPSDHATYRWRGLLCVKPTSDDRTPAFKRRVVYGGKSYFCRK